MMDSESDSERRSAPRRRPLTEAEVSSPEDCQYGPHYHLASKPEKARMRAAHAAASQEMPSLRGSSRLARKSGSAAAGSSTAAPAAAALPPSTPTGREASRLVMVDMLEFEPAGLRGVALSGGRTRADPPSSRKRRSMDARMQAAADQPQQSRAKGKQRQRAENWEEGAAPAGFPAAIEEEEDAADGHAAEQAAGHPRSPALRGSGAPAGGARDAANAADAPPVGRGGEGAPSDSDSDTGADAPPPVDTFACQFHLFCSAISVHVSMYCTSQSHGTIIEYILFTSSIL